MSLRVLSPLNGVIIRGHHRNREIAAVISLGHRDSVLTKWRLICRDRTSRRGDDDIIRVGTASALCLHCTPSPGRADALKRPIASQTRTIDYVFY